MRQWAQKDDFDLENESAHLSVLQTSLESHRKLLTAQTTGRYWKSGIGNRESVPFPEFMWLGFGFTGCGSVIFSTFVRVMKISCLSCQAQPKALLRLQRTDVKERRLCEDLPKWVRSDHQALRRHPRGGVIVPETMHSKTFFCVHTTSMHQWHQWWWSNPLIGHTVAPARGYGWKILNMTWTCRIAYMVCLGMTLPIREVPLMGMFCGSVSGGCSGVLCVSPVFWSTKMRGLSFGLCFGGVVRGMIRQSRTS